MLGEVPSLEPMIAEFESESCFLTYQGERNPSISANCNILMCLLRSSHWQSYKAQIMKCSVYLLGSWQSGNIRDKWVSEICEILFEDLLISLSQNISLQYPMMLIVQSLTILLGRYKGVELEEVDDTLLSVDIPRALEGIFVEILKKSSSEYGPDEDLEVIAYSVLAVDSLLTLPINPSLKRQGVDFVRRGREFLSENQHLWQTGKPLWIEKVAFSSSNLSRAYCIAALKGKEPSLPSTTMKFAEKEKKQAAKFGEFFVRLPLFSDTPYQELHHSLGEAFGYLPNLREQTNFIFPPMAKTIDQGYLNYIPFTWILPKNLRSTKFSQDLLFDMMLISMVNFQVDAYMESVLEKLYKDNLEVLKNLICEICESFCPRNTKRKADEQEIERPAKRNTSSNLETSMVRPEADNPHYNDDILHSECSTTTNGTPYGPEEEARKVLQNFVSHVLHHPRVLKSSSSLQSWLRYEIQAFLLAHVIQMEDCARLAVSSEPRTTYYQWARTTGSDHTSCPYSFVFFLCLINDGKSSSACFSTHQRYLLEDAGHHLAAMCRQYNDFGSLDRDLQENNLNSINFPEFGKISLTATNSSKEFYPALKVSLLGIAEYERRCLDMILGELRPSLDTDVLEKLKLFVDVTDLYGQIYVARDIGIRKV